MELKILTSFSTQAKGPRPCRFKGGDKGDDLRRARFQKRIGGKNLSGYTMWECATSCRGDEKTNPYCMIQLNTINQQGEHCRAEEGPVDCEESKQKATKKMIGIKKSGEDPLFFASGLIFLLEGLAADRHANTR